MLEEIYHLWEQFLHFFPSSLRWITSLIIFGLLVKLIISLIKKSFIWLILLVLFVPASIPLLKEIFGSVFRFLQKVLP